MFAGWITFSAERAGEATIVRAHVLLRANDRLWELGMTFGGHAEEDRFWAQTLTSPGTQPSRRHLVIPMPGDADAIVVGSGPNGLAAAVTLAAAGLRVHVIEGAASPGGGCRTEELTLPGFRHDVCSSGHPLALASPFFRRFDPAAWGVRFAHPEVVYAHPLDGGRAAVVTRSVPDTAAGLGKDEVAYRRLMQPLADGGDALADAVLSSMRRPPRYSGALAAYARLGLRSAAAVARRFHTDEARGLFAGVAAHAMLPLTAPPTAGVALLLGSLAHTAGWPVVAC